MLHRICCALRFVHALCFKIRAGARVTQGIESHMLCVGPGLIKFTFPPKHIQRCVTYALRFVQVHVSRRGLSLICFV
jgi:hypothetical protein